MYKNTLCLYLLVFITQTLVKSRSIISPPDLENKETPVEAEIDDGLYLNKIKIFINAVQFDGQKKETNNTLPFFTATTKSFL